MAEVKVTKGNGESKIYTIEMDFAPGKITNLTNKLGNRTYRALYNMHPLNLTELKNIYNSVKNGWEEYCTSYVDRYISGISNIGDDTTKIPSGKALFSGTGEFISDYYGTGVKWFTMWIAKESVNGSTSTFFNGATWIATGNNEKGSDYMTGNHNDAITFTIDRRATVYILSQSSLFTNFDANSWTKNDSGYRLYHGDGGSFTNVFTKHFNSGEVNIPTQGTTLNRMYIPIITWDEPEGFDNTQIDSITYKMSDNEQYTALEGVSAEIDSYCINIPFQADTSYIPKINVVPLDPRSEVYIKYPQSVPNTEAVITITSVTGHQRHYTVRFEYEDVFNYIFRNNNSVTDISELVIMAERVTCLE